MEKRDRSRTVDIRHGYINANRSEKKRQVEPTNGQRDAEETGGKSTATEIRTEKEGRSDEKRTIEQSNLFRASG